MLCVHVINIILGMLQTKLADDKCRWKFSYFSEMTGFTFHANCKLEEWVRGGVGLLYKYYLLIFLFLVQNCSRQHFEIFFFTIIIFQRK